MRSELEQEYERPPSPNELADCLDLHVLDVHETIKISARHVSMDEPISNEDDSGNMYDILCNEDDSINPDQGLLMDSLRKEIERSLSTLTEREANVIRYFYGLNSKHPWSLEEIGAHFSLTRERVRQIREKAIKRLKNASRSEQLKVYLG